MSPVFVTTATFLLFLGGFTLVGILSARKRTQSSEDYLVASRNVHPWLAALSAVSTNNSGHMFIGLVGFTWRSGVEAIWITFGWVLGDLLTWFWVHRRVREQSEHVSANSVPALLATDRNGKVHRPVLVAAGLLTFVFLGGYAAAQLKAGSTTLHVLFDWPIWLGAVVGVVVVALYSFSGGIRASIWTDAVQSVVMMVAMAVLVGTCMFEVGGPLALLDALSAIDPQLVNLTPNGIAFGLGLYILGFVFGGIGTIGQPHILIRFMAIDSEASIKRAGVIYFAWYVIFSVFALSVGLYARVILPDLDAGLTEGARTIATEGALPQLSLTLLSPVMVGVILAGLFAATMSTADSQILACSAAITQDLVPRWKDSYRLSKLSTLVVALVALGIALTASSGVFSLVLTAWSVLGATLGPVLLVRLANRPLPTPVALTMMASGLATVFLWGASPWAGSIYEMLPGLVVPMLVYAAFAVGTRWSRPPSTTR